MEMSLPFAVMLGVHVLTQNRDHLRSPARPAVQACLCFGAAVAILVGMIESQSRMGFIASVAALFVIGVLAARSRYSARGASWRFRLWVLAAAAMAALAFFILPSGQLLTRFASLPIDSGLVQEGPLDQDLSGARLQIYKESLPIVADYAAAGCGLGAFESCYLPYKKGAPWNTNGYVHGDYIQLMAEFGLPAFACLVALAALAYGSALRRTKSRNPGRWLAIACVGALSAILLHSFADWNLYMPANGLLAVWVAAIARECERLASIPGGPRPRVRFHQRPDYRRPEAGSRGGRQRATGAGTGRRHRPREERQVDGSAHGELAVAETGAGAPERAGHHDNEGPARPRHHRRPSRLRPAPVRGGGSYDGAHTAARWPLVYRGPPG
jgi:hypothetical protein